MGVKKNPVSPRQKMINLMYVVLMAMLALNVSTDVLKGLVLVGDSLQRSTENAEKETLAIYEDFQQQMKVNPTKVGPWFKKATAVKAASDSLCNYAERLKLAIARKADGKNGDPMNLKNKEDLHASDDIMLNSLEHNGKHLFEEINKYRELIGSYISDPRKKAIAIANLNTDVPDTPENKGRKWEEYMFESMPAIAAITMLSKLQSDIRSAEREVLHSLSSNIGVKDIRVNQLDAFCLPEQLVLFPGDEFRSRIFMAATDTTKRPEIYVNGNKIAPDGQYNFHVGGVGKYSFSGYILVPNITGEMIRREFTQEYTVVPRPDNSTPTGATVAADLMNVLYAGFENPVSVTATGIMADKVSLSMSGGTLTSTGNGHYTARPERVGQDVTFTVTGTYEGKSLDMGTYTFKVRKLPDPTAFITVGDDMFKGGKLSKSALLGARSLGAAIDDGLLHIPFHVTSFECVFFDRMGNVRPERSSGSSFTDQQRELMRELGRGKRLYISNIHAIGPDKIERTLPGAMEIIVN